MSSKKIILVGYSPSHRGEATPDDPLGVSGPGSGRTLAKLCGLTNDEYMRAFDRVNLHYHTPEKKTSVIDRESAELLAAKLIDRRVIFVGQAVAKAFGFDLMPLAWQSSGHGLLYVIKQSAMIPHPSGLNRWYNDPKNVLRAEKFLRSCTN